MNVIYYRSQGEILYVARKPLALVPDDIDEDRIHTTPSPFLPMKGDYILFNNPSQRWQVECVVVDIPTLRGYVDLGKA